MKVWLISKKEPDGRCHGRECVVLEKPEASADYAASEFTLIGSKEQREAVIAQTQVSKLSQPARKKLGITFRNIARLNRLAEPPLKIKPGDTVYASVNTRSPSEVSGIYTWKHSVLDEWCYGTKVYADLGTYVQEKTARMVNQEVDGVSASTRRLLGLKV